MKNKINEFNVLVNWNKGPYYGKFFANKKSESGHLQYLQNNGDVLHYCGDQGFFDTFADVEAAYAKFSPITWADGSPVIEGEEHKSITEHCGAIYRLTISGDWVYIDIRSQMLRLEEVEDFLGDIIDELAIVRSDIEDEKGC